MNHPGTIPNPFILAGPTASGKSTLASMLAGHWQGEIVNADPFQSYRSIPILTAQPEDTDPQAVPHHLYGFRSLSTECNAALMADEVMAVVRDIQTRQRLPIIVSGSGLYLAALIHGLDDNLPQANPTWRETWQSRPLSELQQELQKSDPAACQLIDMKNPRRVLRALEITHLTGQPFSQLRSHSRPAKATTIAGVWLNWPRPLLRERIAARTRSMFTAGLIEEIKAISDQSLAATATKAIGMETIQALIRNEISIDDAMETITRRTQQYAKRQATWFRRESALAPLAVPNQQQTDLPATLFDQITRQFAMP